MALTKTLKSWPSRERPRERLFSQGVQSLSDAELIAILLGSGTKSKNVIDLARDLIGNFKGLRGLFSTSPGELETVRGLGPAKIATLAAVSELTKRLLREESRRKSFIDNPQSIVDYLYQSLRDQKKEYVALILLNKAGEVLNDVTVASGSLDHVSIQPRDIVKVALDQHAASIVLVHNHPSGSIDPSHADRMMTQKVRHACQTVDIPLIDHLIIGDNRYFSFRENQLLEAVI